MIGRLRSFGAFWYDFVVGDDWQVAVGVVVALALTAGLSRTGVSVWWIVPLAVALLLPYGLYRATRAQRPSNAPAATSAGER